MTDTMPDSALAEIEHRAVQALDVAPAPWNPWLETDGGIGGGSFIRCGDDDLAPDTEIYLDVHVGTKRLASPDAQLDTIIDFVAHAPTDIARLIAEIRRLRSSLS